MTIENQAQITEQQNQTDDSRNPNWGGARKNAGRKKKYGEVTKVLTFRIPISKVEEVKSAIKYIVSNGNSEF
jgi:hypothetical protein